MIKIAILISLFLASTYLGFQTATVYDEKLKFYQDCTKFLKNIKSEISFFKTDLISMFDKFKFQSKFETLKNSIKDLYIQNKEFNIQDIKNIIDKTIIIDDDEKNKLAQMFFEIGKIGYYEQLEKISYYIQAFDEIESRVEQKKNKMMPFCKKMGAIIGVLLCIILI